jgi:hypothetical protein
MPSRVLVRSVAVTIAILVPAGLAGADEADLERQLVGRTVMARLDLPATRKGLDYYPQRSTPIDDKEHQKRLSQAGVGVRQGDVVTVTKINVKGKHIEFHLGEGGDSQMPTRASTYVPRSDYEKDLEEELKNTQDATQKKKLEKQLSAERDRRLREERLLKAVAEQEYQAALSQRTPEEWALLAGSRVNVRFDGNVPNQALSPEGLRSLLSEVFDFDPKQAPAPAEASDVPVTKGQSRTEVDAALGQPRRCTEEEQGMLMVEVCTYPLGEATLEARFVDGVLVRYVLTSN